MKNPTCPTCAGSGKIIVTTYENGKKKRETIKCATCNGKGTLPVDYYPHAW